MKSPTFRSMPYGNDPAEDGIGHEIKSVADEDQGHGPAFPKGPQASGQGESQPGYQARQSALPKIRGADAMTKHLQGSRKQEGAEKAVGHEQRHPLLFRLGHPMA